MATRRKASGANIPETQRTTIRVALRLPPDIAEDLDALAAQWKMTRSGAVGRLVEIAPDGCDEQGCWTWQGEWHPPPRETSGASRDDDSSELASPVEVANTTPARGPEEAGTYSTDDRSIER